MGANSLLQVELQTGAEPPLLRVEGELHLDRVAHDRRTVASLRGYAEFSLLLWLLHRSSRAPGCQTLPFCVSLAEFGVEGLHHHRLAGETLHLLPSQKILLLSLDFCSFCLRTVDLDGHGWLFSPVVGIIQVFVQLQFQIRPRLVGLGVFPTGLGRLQFGKGDEPAPGLAAGSCWQFQVEVGLRPAGELLRLVEGRREEQFLLGDGEQILLRRGGVARLEGGLQLHLAEQGNYYIHQSGFYGFTTVAFHFRPLK